MSERHAAAPHPIDELPWDQFSKDLLERGHDGLRDRLVSIRNGSRRAIDVDRLDDAVDIVVDTGEDAEDVDLRQEIMAGLEGPACAVLLLAYLYARYLKIWEDTSNWNGIRALIDITVGAVDATFDVLAESDPLAAEQVRLLIQLIRSIDPAMEVESGLNCSCPVTMQHAAQRVIALSASVLRALDTTLNGNDEDVLSLAKAILRDPGARSGHGCREFVRFRAAVDLIYFSSVSTVSNAVVDYIEGEPDTFTKLTDVIEDTLKNEELLIGDVYESELRSHRLGLKSLLEARNRLHVDSANVIYCYPFTVPWADPGDLVRAAKRCREDAPDTVPPWRFADQTAMVEDLELTDMWDGPAAHKYTGVTISFGLDPYVLTRAEEILKDFSEDLSYSLEIRLSRLGNHLLRFQHRLTDATIHDLNQSMRRAMPQMGEETITFGPPRSRDETGGVAQRKWARLSDLAEDLIDSLVTFLEPLVDHDELGNARPHGQPATSLPNERRVKKKERAQKELSKERANGNDTKTPAHGGQAAKPEPPRHAHPHVIVTARKLSLEQLGSVEDDRSFRRDISVEELPEAKGASLLLQPLRQAAAILEEWSRYSLPELDDGATMQPMSFVGNFAYRTTNTTCGLLRGVPEYLIIEHEEAAEFVASLPVLLETWMAQILDRADTSDLGDEPSTEVLNGRQLELRQILTRATTLMAQIRSPELCLTAVHRKYLDEMFHIAGIDRLERELQSHFTVLDANYEMLATKAAKREQRRLDMQGFFFGAGAVLVGVPSLAAVFALFDSGLAVHRSGDTIEAVVLTALIVLLFVAVLKLPGAKDVLQALNKWLRTAIDAIKKAAVAVAHRVRGSRRAGGSVQRPEIR